MLIFVASSYFYMALIPEYILILYFLILIDFFSARVIERSEGQKRKRFLIVSIVLNVGLLCFFKYLNFFGDNIGTLIHLFGVEKSIPHLEIILPIGLSFHTFQSMAYVIEVYRKRQKAETHIGYFANYVLFFPQMVAGPIERYNRLGEQLQANHSLKYKNFSDGFRLILIGFFAKMVIADNLAPYVNTVYDNPSQFS